MKLLRIVILLPLVALENIWAQPEIKRPVTIADAIEMTKLGDRLYYRGAPSRGLVTHFSPNGNHFVVVLRKGDLERNANDYSMLLWNAQQLSSSQRPTVLVSLSSTSNREGIKEPRWLDDNETVAFIGETPGSLPQLYTVNSRTLSLNRVTHHPTGIIDYSITTDGRNVVFTAQDQQPTTLFDEKAHRNGVLVARQWLPDLIAGRIGGRDFDLTRLFFQSAGGESRELSTKSRIALWPNHPYLSPDGRYALMATYVTNVPNIWKEYSDPEIRQWAAMRLDSGQYTSLRRYELVDIEKGESRVLFDAPIGASGSEAAWAPDARSVVLSNIYLPLNGLKDEVERTLRASHAYTLEVTIPGGEITKISDEPLKLLRWDQTDNRLLFEKGRRSLDGASPAVVLFRKQDGRWSRLEDQTTASNQPEVILKEDINNAPKLYFTGVDGERLLLDLNPQFSRLQFGKVEEIIWTGSDGHSVKGGLYYPVGYIPGKRYPLVIQTHGFVREKFWIDGPWPTAFAAQPLAGKGIMVLQADMGSADMDTAQEVHREISTFEGAIDFLDQKGLIDRSRVGIIGFSRTCLYVKYALTHSRYHFAAASVTDGADGGYLSYTMAVNANPLIIQMYEKINGGQPFGDGLQSWIKNSPGFNQDKVETPLRIVAVSGASLLGEWEWFAGLYRLHKPVELVLIPESEHILQKPCDRMISQQGNVDWFAFWLKGEEDPDPNKADQYSRWRQMRKMPSNGR